MFAGCDAMTQGLGRLSLMAIVVGLAIAAVVFWLERPLHSVPVSQPAIGGEFHLIDQNGAAADANILRGKWTAVYFGYSFCPDACPMTLSALAQTQTTLAATARRLNVVFITVDPARDTPAQLKTYLASPSFPKGATGLTGTPAQIAQVAKAYHVWFKPSDRSANYSVDHTSVVYLMGPDGAFRVPLGFGLPPGELVQQIRQAMDRG